MLKKVNRALVILLISLMTATVLNFKPVYPVTPPTEVAVINPQNPLNPGAKDGNFVFYTNTTSVGFKFNATLWVFGYGTPPVFAWQVRLNYNPTIINVTGAWNAVGDAAYIFTGRTSLNLVPAIGVGTILVGDSLLVGAGETPPPDPAKLATIEFEIILAPPTNGKVFTTLDIDIADTTLLDDSLAEIPLTKTSGYYEFSDIKAMPPPATMYVDPSRIVDPTLVPSNNFNVSIKIANATNVNGFVFKLSYNASVLHNVNVLLGDFFPSADTQNITDNVAGYVIFNATLTTPPPRNGTGTLAVVTFHVEGLGESILDLTDTALADQAGDTLPQTPPGDGYFNNILQAKLYVDPAEIIDPLLKPPKIFSVDIVIDDVEDLYGYEFRLSYDTGMLTTIGIAIHPILNETNFTTNMMVNDGTGQIWINVTYYSPANPITTYNPESLVTLTFKVDAIGSSVLDLYDTKLVDSIGGPISHAAIDGFVMTLIRDVAILDVVPSTSFAFAGELVDINVTAKNKGNSTETFDVSAYYNTTLIGTQTVTDLASNAETTLTFTWNTSEVSDGIYTIKGEATFVPYEFNTSDNVYIDGTVEIVTRIRDLAILNVTTSANATFAGWPVNITVVVENQGMDPENATVSVYWNTTNLIDERTITNLLPNATITLVFTWDTTNLTECKSYRIGANVTLANPDPPEIDTADNMLEDGYVKIKIMGDVNGDGKVDILDLAILSQAFGSYPGHPRWNPDADLNRDGKVDIMDLAMGASNFGRTCS